MYRFIETKLFPSIKASSFAIVNDRLLKNKIIRALFRHSDFLHENYFGNVHLLSTLQLSVKTHAAVIYRKTGSQWWTSEIFVNKIDRLPFYIVHLATHCITNKCRNFAAD